MIVENKQMENILNIQCCINVHNICIQPFTSRSHMTTKSMHNTLKSKLLPLTY